MTTTWRTDRPMLLYWLLAGLVYGWFASFSFGVPVVLGQTARDIWQHLAALQALIDDPARPGNPFIVSDAPSRLYGPVHVAAGWLAHWFGWTQVQAYGAIAVFALALLAAGQFVFARAYFASRWGPLALFATMLLGWPVAIEFTGFHSVLTLVEDAGLPATVAIGAGLLSWGMTIRLLERPTVIGLAGLALLVAAMVVDHQLGAGIALVGIAAFGVFRPASMRARITVAIATAAGIGLAAAWPYFNPYAVLATAGNKTWDAAPGFYSVRTFAIALLPAVVGVFGLRRPTLAMLAVYAAVLALALTGQPVAHRFLAPVVLVLHIGAAQLVLDHWQRWWWLIAALGVTLAATQLPSDRRTFAVAERDLAHHGNLLDDARQLLADKPAGIAGYRAAAMPVVAAGMRVYISTYTETLIPDQAARLARNHQLFVAPIDAGARRAMARRLGISVLVAERGKLPADAARRLAAQSVRVRSAGPLQRYDLFFAALIRK